MLLPGQKVLNTFLHSNGLVTTEPVRCQRCCTWNQIAFDGVGVPHCGKCGAALPWVVEANDHAIDDLVMRSNQAVLLYFWAAWARESVTLRPVVNEMAQKFAGSVRVVVINLDESPHYATRYNLHYFPACLLFVKHSVAGQLTGVVSSISMEAWIRHYLPASMQKAALVTTAQG